MAAAVIRNMPIGQPLHVLPNNCVIMSSMASNQPNPAALLQHHHHQLQQQQYHQQQQQQLHHHTTTHAIHSHHQSGKRPIAPAPVELSRSTVISSMDHSQNRSSSSSSSSSASASASKKAAAARMAFMPYGAQPASVQRRNARERNRVKQVNNGFANLRQHIPSDVVTALTHGGRGASKKLSKVDTLRMAVEYIRRLQDLLDDGELDASSSASTRSSQLSAETYFSNSSIPPPPCSDSSASPTPSYSSENSSVSNSYVPPVQSYKYEVFDNYNPEDEELLDCISWWQQEQQ